MCIMTCWQEIFEIKNESGKLNASSLHKETLDGAAMNSATSTDSKNFMCAVGVDEFCHLYELKHKIVAPKNGENSEKQLRADNIFFYTHCPINRQ